METPQIYAPPQSSVATTAFEPKRGISTFLVILLLFGVVLKVGLGAGILVGNSLYPGWMNADPELADPSHMILFGVIGLGALAQVFVFIVTVVVFCIWIYKANTNARALGAKWMEYSPGWAVAWWFIPIANLFKPYQVVAEVYRASDPERPPDSWKHLVVPPVFTLWWATWIASNIVGNFSGNAVFGVSNRYPLLTTLILIAEVGLAVVASFAVIHIIRAIDARQLAKSQAPPVAVGE